MENSPPGGNLMVTSFGLISPELTTIIEALDAFQDFEPEVRRTAGALHAAKLGLPQLHFYASALHTDLGGVQ